MPCGDHRKDRRRLPVAAELLSFSPPGDSGPEVLRRLEPLPDAVYLAEGHEGAELIEFRCYHSVRQQSKL
jgi:hypothetical protein